MTRALPLLVICCILATACGTQAPERPPAGLLRTIDQAPAGTSAPIDVPSPTSFTPATPTPELVSDVLPAVAPPSALAVRGGTSLPVPNTTGVVWGGCASDGRCYSYNFYWAPTHEAVMQAGEPSYKVQHELCHAHQHWTINRGEPLSPSDYDLESWYSTAEGQSYAAAVAGLAWPWSHSAVNGLEDFAWTCAYWYVDPVYLSSSSPERYTWAAANLP